MKFIQSFWSKPLFDISLKNNWNFRFNGGFPSSFLFYASWVYSCLSIKKYYPNLHLVSDDFGIKIFKEELDLPYVSFSNSLNDLNNYHKNLWALGKIYTYKIQKEPFCHIDGDVFFFGSVLDPILDSPIFCQSFNNITIQYKEIHSYIHKHFNNVPNEYEANLKNKINFINAGVLGGSDLKLFKLYTSKVFELLDNNSDKIDDIKNASIFNLYFEQFLLSNIITTKKVEFMSIYSEPNNKNELDFAAFHKIPFSSKYVHLLSHLKKSTEYLEQIVARLKIEYPNHYNKLISFYKKYENT